MNSNKRLIDERDREADIWRGVREIERETWKRVRDKERADRRYMRMRANGFKTNE